jgi:pimeloyl-ACP methyl ester carboxylesterase
MLLTHLLIKFCIPSPEKHMQINYYLHLLITILLFIAYHSLQSSDGSSINHPPVAYGQNQSSSFQAAVRVLDEIPDQKVKVGDLDISFKQLGNNTDKPIVLINGHSTSKDMWSPTLLKELSANRMVIIFDNRGVGESTVGTKQFSINQFANDTMGLLDVLNITDADILGFSMGSFIAQELALKNPNRVNSLILYASSCGGTEAVPPNPQALQAIDALTNTSTPTQEGIDKITSTMFPPEWFKANPNYQNYIPLSRESAPPEIVQRQENAIISWFTKGTCEDLSNITQPTLVIVGTEDIWTPAVNSLMIAEKVPAAWLVQIRDSGHGLMYQYPDKFTRVVSTFLESVN